jgi:hypothetical protein
VIIDRPEAKIAADCPTAITHGIPLDQIAEIMEIPSLTF